MRSLAILIAGSVGLWLMALGPAWWFGGSASVTHSAVALGLCLVPAVATLAIVARTAKSPEATLLATFGATGIRMGVVLGAGWFLHANWPERFPASFLYWLVFFYLAVLGLEVTLVVRQQPDVDASATKREESTP